MSQRLSEEERRYIQQEALRREALLRFVQGGEPSFAPPPGTVCIEEQQLQSLLAGIVPQGWQLLSPDQVLVVRGWRDAAVRVPALEAGLREAAERTSALEAALARASAQELTEAAATERAEYERLRRVNASILSRQSQQLEALRQQEQNLSGLVARLERVRGNLA